MNMEAGTLQSLFGAAIIEQVYLDPGYSGHANDVWWVQTANEDVVVRVRRETTQDTPFQDGCLQLFGIHPTGGDDLRALNALLGSLGSLPVPPVVRTGAVAGRSCVVVERAVGMPLERFAMLSDSGLESFGRGLAQIHRHPFRYFGSPVGDTRYPLSQFPTRVIDTMRYLGSRYFRHDIKMSIALEEMCQDAECLLPPEFGSLVMVDIDPTQFLTDGTEITAMVDTEAYVVGPRELDFVGLEYVCDLRCAVAIARGYASVLQLPHLAQSRPIYRYLYRQLEVQGARDLDHWLTHPALFDLVSF